MLLQRLQNLLEESDGVTEDQSFGLLQNETNGFATGYFPHTHVAGIEARGSRQTRTIPPGEEGNELPLIVTNETWASRELGVTLVQITDNPRYGRNTFQVEELSRTEPDAAVFAPPAGYKIEARALPSVMAATP